MEWFKEIATIMISLCIGGGGVGIFNFIINKKKIDNESRSTSVLEWKDLYDTMKERLDEQEKENENLKKEIEDLKAQIFELTTDISMYKHYNKYIRDLETYNDHILHTLQTCVSEEAFKQVLAKKPIRIEIQNSNH